MNIFVITCAWFKNRYYDKVYALVQVRNSNIDYIAFMGDRNTFDSTMKIIFHPNLSDVPSGYNKITPHQLIDITTPDVFSNIENQILNMKLKGELE